MKKVQLLVSIFSVKEKTIHFRDACIKNSIQIDQKKLTLDKSWIIPLCFLWMLLIIFLLLVKLGQNIIHKHDFPPRHLLSSTASGPGNLWINTSVPPVANKYILISTPVIFLIAAVMYGRIWQISVSIQKQTTNKQLEQDAERDRIEIHTRNLSLAIFPVIILGLISFIVPLILYFTSDV